VPETSLTTAFKRSRDRSPDRIAVACGEESWTYAELDRVTDHIAINLLAAGLEPGDRVAIHLLNGPEVAFCQVGCLKAGAIVVPINARLKGREIDYILRHSGSSIYIGQPELYGETAPSCPALAALPRYLTAGAASRGIRPFADLCATPLRSARLPALVSDQPAAILYTSGTTANPKGAVHTHRTLLETANAMRQMRLDEDQTALVMSSMAHGIGFAMLFVSALVNGAPVVITRPFDTDSFLDAFARWSCTYTLGVPVMFECLLRAQTAAPRNVASGRFFFCGGDSVAPALQEAFRPVFGPICEVYGCTEVTPAAWNRPGDVRVGSIGIPGDGVEFRLVDVEGVPVKTGTVGEICIKAPHLMAGYWQDVDAGDGWFPTGDLARADADGFYWFSGRKKEIIIRGGSNISPQEVEAVLYEHPEVAEAAVVGRPDEFWGEIVVAHIALRPGSWLDEEELIAFAKGRLADYKTPEAVVFHSELPKGPTGKLRRRALRETAAVASL
jgi:long-chain acyl-CoA synthetase